jgi:signal transduction histidine kinase
MVTERRTWAPRWPGTVRWRVTLLAAIAVAFVLVVTGLVLLVVQRGVLTDKLDESLTADAERVIASTTGGGEPIDALSADDEAVAQIVTLDGTVVAASNPAVAGGAIAAAPRGAAPSFGTIDGPLEGTGSYRVLSRRFVAHGRDLVVHVAAPLDDVRDAVRALSVTLAFLIPAVTGILAAVVWLLVGRTLRPVEQIRGEVDGIGLGELDRRVPQPPGRDEIARLAGTMNEMLDRLDASNRQQQRFVADASHELRTPLARLRTEIEVAQAAPAASTTDGEVLRSLHDEVDNLQRLTDDLLVLARNDAGVSDGAGRAVDLDDVVLEEVRAVDAHGLSLDTRRVSAAQVLGHREQLRRVVANLLDNAVRHAERSVTVRLAETDGVVQLEVADDGPGVPAGRQADVFERFGRLDESRTEGRGGTGLGLAIARDLVERHGGTIAVDSHYEAGARFVVTLPSTSAS